jgi:hypothetical protein
MRHHVSLLVAAALLGAGPATAQSPNAPAAAQEMEKPPLSPEKQLEVKTSITRFSRGLRPGQDLPRVADKLAVGATVPTTMELINLPQDTVTEVATTTTYRFLLMRDGIAVVDPDTRKVVQIIE